MAIDREIYNHIKCPYCFKEFAHNQVLFRAATFFKEVDLDPDGKGETLEEIEFNMPDGPAKTKRIDEYRRRKVFLLRDDENYTQFWSEFGSTTEKSTGIDSSVPDYKRPIIYPSVNLVVPMGAVLDEEGFTYKIEDCYGRESYDRVCPYCHNPLPNNYGKHPVNFLSVIGISEAGKTVFLSKLIENIGDYAAKLNMSALPASNNSRQFVKDNKIAKNVPLPGATVIKNMSQPLFYNLTYMDKGVKKNRIFVIYDIAGENCSDSHLIEKYGKFVKNSHGLIVLLDPRQIKSLGGTSENLTESVLATLKNTITNTERVSTPLALCISKSDTLKQNGCLPDICFEDVRTVENRYFCARDYNIISNEIYKLFDDKDKKINVELNHSYKNFNYFAFTTLNCSATKDKDGRTYPDREPDPKRIEEPLFWLFNQFGYIKSDIPISDHSQLAIDIREIQKTIDKKEAELSSLGPFAFSRRRDLRTEIEELTYELEQKRREKISK
ncbi:MAG: hypothetical protein ACI4RM_07315 [Ruminococcus sp.]